ncbi:Bardet-Biedl syndrome 1 protein-like [Saccostrea cucullata]|uniref:Bardet-Biedl syndrome 1 protein-like n=1 Tax=Saccostrea cuccullata TaxID=36930 RepID=UPI002ED6A2A9
MGEHADIHVFPDICVGENKVSLCNYKSKGFKAVIVALNNCQVHIYKEKYLVNVIKTDYVVKGLKFGQFGREEGTLIMTLNGGGLMIKILKRNATFEEKDLSGGPPPPPLRTLASTSRRKPSCLWTRP